ncbi:Teichoic acid poly(glycerol phosphate) polymerase [Patescibacteria group bacterium]|nr:Teichoic acid poly(glycerol phosphate) polymerase [Patescibacteria group bacterium]
MKISINYYINKFVKGIRYPGLIGSFLFKFLQIFYFNSLFYINHLSGKKNMIFEITSLGELWYVEPIWSKLKENKNIEIYFSARNDEFNFPWSEYILYLEQYGVSKKRIIFSKITSHIRSCDLFLSPTAWSYGIPRGDIPKIQIFHTLGSKSLLDLDKLLQFNAIFLTGPQIHDQLSLNFLKKYAQARKIKIFDIGYPKSDALINKSYNRDEIMRLLSINPAKPTIIYAPNWEVTASLHKMGNEIIQTLAKMDINLLVKLHHSSYHNPENIFKTGGIDWKKKMEQYSKMYPNVVHIFDFNSNPYLFVSDIMITDAGGVGFEYVLLNKPIIYIDVPEYFDQYGREGIDFWGRSAGNIIKKPEELPETIKKNLSNPEEYSDNRKELINKLIYNPGNAANKAAEAVLQLLAK